MPSPFPGTDPYLERHWGDVHTRLVTYASDRLQQLLPRDLRARVEECVFLEAYDGHTPDFIPDVRILQRPRREGPVKSASIGIGVADPLVVQTDDEITQRFIEIRDAGSGHQLVTVIEVLSPSNKVPGDGQVKYLQKRQELRAGRVSVVEIDLVRTGKRLLPFPMEKLIPEFRTTYQVWVRRGWEATRVEVYRVPLREHLPVIPIPLQRTDADVPLDLQAIIDQCYRNGGYDDDIDYQVGPEPPLDADDARWADSLLRKKKLRSKKKETRPKRRKK